MFGWAKSNLQHLLGVQHMLGQLSGQVPPEMEGTVSDALKRMDDPSPRPYTLPEDLVTADLFEAQQQALADEMRVKTDDELFDVVEEAVAFSSERNEEAAFNELKRRVLAPAPSYHALNLTTKTIPRTPLVRFQDRIDVTCGKVSGWEAWHIVTNTDPKAHKPTTAVRLGGEFTPDNWIRLDVAGHIIVDSEPKEEV